MNPEERIASYQEAVDVLNNYTAQEAAKIGNSQASLGLMAERVARPSGTTSGLANYTYDRTLRPTLDSLAASLTTTGYSQGLEKQLYDALTAAKNRYEDAKNRYTVASTVPKTTNPSGGSGWTEQIGTKGTGEEEQETVETTDQVVTGTSALDWGKNWTTNYVMLGGASMDGSRPGEYVFQNPDGTTFRMTLPNGHEFVVDPTTGNLVTRPKK